MGNNACFVVLLAFFALSSALNFQFTSNFSSSAIKDNGWNFQAVDLNVINVNLGILGWLGGNFKSADSQGSLFSGSSNIVTGSAYIALGGIPFSFLSYFSSNFNLNISSGQDYAGANVAASAGYVGTAYLFLEEVNSTGAVVATRTLEWEANIANNNGFTYTLSDQNTNNAAAPYYVTFSGTSNNENDKLTVSLSFLVSSVAGIVNDDIKLVPKSLESVITINNYPYATPSNSLNLVLGVGTGSAQVSASGNSVYSGDGNVYFSLNNQATVDGKIHNVGISAFTSGSVDAAANTDFSSQLSAKYGAGAEFKIVRVSFPAGATSITFDPSIGSGKSALDSGASSVAPLASLVLLLIVAFAL